MNTYGEFELDHAQNQAEPENQAGLVPGPDPDKIKNCKNFFQKIKPTTLPIHHVKGQPAAPTYVRKKACVTFDTNRDTPCSTVVIIWSHLITTGHISHIWLQLGN